MTNRSDAGTVLLKYYCAADKEGECESGTNHWNQVLKDVTEGGSCRAYIQEKTEANANAPMHQIYYSGIMTGIYKTRPSIELFSICEEELDMGYVNYAEERNFDLMDR